MELPPAPSPLGPLTGASSSCNQGGPGCRCWLTGVGVSKPAATAKICAARRLVQERLVHECQQQGLADDSIKIPEAARLTTREHQARHLEVIRLRAIEQFCGRV